jgi:hypothetical protein
MSMNPLIDPSVGHITSFGGITIYKSPEFSPEQKLLSKHINITKQLLANP